MAQDVEKEHSPDKTTWKSGQSAGTWTEVSENRRSVKGKRRYEDSMDSSGEIATNKTEASAGRGRRPA